MDEMDGNFSVRRACIAGLDEHAELVPTQL
jgi:hypothetical protein